MTPRKSREAPQAGTDDPRVAKRPGSQPVKDEVAMVSRLADGSDAQPNPTGRVLDEKAATEADRAQLAIVDK